MNKNLFSYMLIEQMVLNGILDYHLIRNMSLASPDYLLNAIKNEIENILKITQDFVTKKHYFTTAQKSSFL